MKSKFFFTVMALLMVLCSVSFAQVPKLINYQGKLTTSAGAPVNDTLQMVFSIYNVPTEGTALWSETQGSVEVLNGAFNVLLGSVDSIGNPIPYSVFDGTTKYLGVHVGGEQIIPRRPMVSVGYAYKSFEADTADFARSGGGGNDWIIDATDGDTTLFTGGAWGIARYGNTLYGNADSTHVNLGVASTTGTSGQNYKYCTVGGGLRNTASGIEATVGGGYSNTASGGSATVGGGANNDADTLFATVGGGYVNTASGIFATVGGGQSNTASGERATVGGGVDNTADTALATVGGGTGNTADGFCATVGGGHTNTASGYYATVGGGAYNSDSGDYSAIPGGYYDTLTTDADYSMAFGYSVYVNNSYRVIFFDRFNSGRLGINRDDHDGGISWPIQVGTNTGNGNGAYLTFGGVWTNGSSRTFKENFQALNRQELLEKISSLPVESWNFKNSPERHIGPVAEDFVSAFDVGAVREDGTRDNKYLSTEDIAGVALAGVKELIKENQEQKQENQELRKMIDKLSQKIAELEKAR
jgi:hypothetical protein